MPGRMGYDLLTKKNLTVIDVRADENIMLVKGSVPGAKQGLLQIFHDFCLNRRSGCEGCRLLPALREHLTTSGEQGSPPPPTRP